MNLHELSCQEFETLIVSICKYLVGEGVQCFRKGPDGGRDAEFDGKAEKLLSTETRLCGRIIIQAKHTDTETASVADSSFSQIIKKEADKIKKRRLKFNVDHYLLFTNRRKPAGAADKAHKIVREISGLDSCYIFGYEEIAEWLNRLPKIRDQFHLNGRSLSTPP